MKRAIRGHTAHAQLGPREVPKTKLGPHENTMNEGK